MRFIGGVSFLTLLSNSHFNFPFFILIIAFFFALIFTIYHFYLMYHRTIHLIKVLKSDKLEVRNSPLDRFAYLSAKALFCFKYGCDNVAPGVGLTLGLMISTDEILKGDNRDPIFTPLLGGLLNKILPNKLDNSNDPNKLIQNSIDLIKGNNSNLKSQESFLEEIKDLKLQGDLTGEEFSEMQKLILENKESLKTKNSEVKSKILELLDQIEKK